MTSIGNVAQKFNPNSDLVNSKNSNMVMKNEGNNKFLKLKFYRVFPILINMMEAQLGHPIRILPIRQGGNKISVQTLIWLIVKIQFL